MATPSNDGESPSLPVKISLKRWFFTPWRALTMRQAEAFWLRKATDLVGSEAQAFALEQAKANRVWRASVHPPVPDCSRCHGTGDYDFERRGTSAWRQQPPCSCRFRALDASSEIVAGLRAHFLSVAAPNDDGRPIPPPMRIVHKGWFKHHELSHHEAEAYNLREAAKLAGSPLLIDRERQAVALREADRNRAWGRIENRVPMTPRPAISRPIEKGN
jgi:hypothetical protein